jgi:hypothetical protein
LRPGMMPRAMSNSLYTIEQWGDHLRVFLDAILIQK